MSVVRSGQFITRVINSRKTRVLVFIFGVFSIFIIDLAATSVGSILSANSFIPFFVFLSIPLLLSARLKSSVIPLIGRCCVPIGVLVAALNSTNVLANATGEIAEDLMSARLAFSPLALGVLLSYLIPLLESPDKQEYVPKKTEAYFFGCTSLVALCGIWTVYFQNPIGWLIETLGIWVVMAVTLISFVYPGGEPLRFSQKFLNSGLFVCVVAAVIGIASYSAAVPLGPKALGPAAIIGIDAMLYGAFLTFVATLLGGQSSMEAKEARYFDWHLIESWAFLALMLLGPAPLFEASQVIQD